MKSYEREIKELRDSNLRLISENVRLTKEIECNKYILRLEQEANQKLEIELNKMKEIKNET